MNRELRAKEYKEQLYDPENIKAKDKESFADVELSEVDINKIVSRVIDDYNNDKTSRKNWEDTKAALYQRYRGKSVRVPPYKGGSDICPPLMQQNIDAILPRVTNAFINEPYVVFTGTEENDKELARNTEKLFNFYLDKEIDYPRLVEEMHADGVLYGTAWLYDYFDFKTKMPGVKVIAVEDVFVPYNTYCTVNELPHVILRDYKPAYEIAEKYKIDKATIIGEVKTLTDLPRVKDEIEGRTDLDVDADKPVETVNWFGRLMLNGVMRDVVVKVAVQSKKMLERWYLNEIVPYADKERRLPLNPIFYKRVKNQFYGVGMGDDIAPLHDWMCSTVNQIIDATNWSIIPWGAFRSSSTFNPQKFEVKHGMMIPLDDVNDVKFYNVPANTRDAFEMLPFIQSNVERASAISDYNQGRESDTNKAPTWRGTSAILQESMIRLDSYIKRAANQMKYTFENLYYWLQKTLDKGDIARILGTVDQNAVDVMDSALTLKYDLRLNLNYGYWNRENERNNLTQMLTMFAADPDIQANKDIRMTMKRDLLKSLGKDQLADMLDQKNAESAEQQREISQMIQGEYVPANLDDDHTAHIKELDVVMNQELWSKLQPMVQESIMGHKSEHVGMFDQLKQQVMANMQAPQMGGQGAPVAPEMPQEATNTEGGMVAPQPETNLPPEVPQGGISQPV